jgi:23S rRNA pseudouridine1911/1915/1917 synthase
MAKSSSLGGIIREFRSQDGNKGWRLDHFLARSLPELSRSRLQGLIAQGRVTRGETTIGDPNHRVKPDEVYRVEVPPPTPAEPEPQAIPLTIVYEDSDLIVIDKPAGLVVHPAAGNLEGTLVNALLAHCGQSLKGIGGVARPGIVHRLDKDTSGLLVAAKNERAMRSLAKQFAKHAVERVYNAVVWGSPRLEAGHVEADLGRNPFDRKRMAVLRGGGKPAKTNYRVLERFGPSAETGEKALASLLECRLETGRTHQIRVHLTHIGHPLLGDATYGRARQPPRPHSPAEKTALEAATVFPRQALHAGVLGFFHPTQQAKLRFESPWPEDFSNLIKILRGMNGPAATGERRLK